jgi:uncharacterized delta-60 repeat protein
MKIRTALLLVPVLLALCVGTAVAKTAPQHGGLDPSFGRDGVAKTATAPTANQAGVRMALGPDGRVYLLQRDLLLAFDGDGKPARDFGNDGRLEVKSTRGEVRAENLTVDSQGRIIVVGSLYLVPTVLDEPTTPIPAGEPFIATSRAQEEAFVGRYLPDGSRDAGFGSGGEVDSTFGLPKPTGQPGKNVSFASPIVTAKTVVVDSQDRPLIGGSWYTAMYVCGISTYRSAAYTARLTAAGVPDASYAAGKGYAETGQLGSVQALAENPEGGLVAVGFGSSCGTKEFQEASRIDSLNGNGEPSPTLDPTRPAFFMDPMLAVDARGRALVVQNGEVGEESALRLVRLRPSGAVDTSFGFGGGTPLVGDLTDAGALAVDAKNRTLVAAGRLLGVGPAVKIVRYTAAGKRDWRFGTKGLLEGGGSGNKELNVSAMAIDGQGRIYTAGWVESKSLKTGSGVQVARFIPGG